jgi:hypothetical protein
MSSRQTDQVWQAFEQEPATKKTPTPLQLERRERGLREMRQGLFVNPLADWDLSTVNQ